VVENMAGMVDALDVRTPRGGQSTFNWRMTPYSGGSDHMMFIDRKVPAVMFSHSPDYTHHTSEDTPDKVDPVELERCELIATGAAWYLANLDERQAEDLVHLVAADGLGRIGEAWRQAAAAMPEPEPPPQPADGPLGTVVEILTTPFRLAEAFKDLHDAFEGIEAYTVRLFFSASREAQAVRSVLGFHEGQRVRQAVEDSTRRLIRASGLIEDEARDADELAAWLAFLETGVDPDAPETPAPRTVPVRLTRGPLDFGLPERQLGAEASAWYREPGFPFTGEMRFELVNEIDGRHDVDWIAAALSTQFHPVQAADVRRYLQDLEKAGVVSWR
jgi:hypothetical protein